MTAVVNIYETRDLEQELARAAATLGRGGLVVLPTETVYGVAGVLTQPEARRRLRELRPGTQSKPLTIHLSDRDQAGRYIGQHSQLARRMMHKLWPGPVGLIFDVPAERRQQVARDLNIDEAEIFSGGSITLRCPDQLVFADVVGRIDQPVAMIVANPSGSNRVDQLLDEVRGKVDMVLDAGPTRYSKPSTLLRITGDDYEILRSGVYDERIIERMMRTTILFVCSGNTCRSPMAEALARSILAEKLRVPPDDLEQRGITIISAGAYALPGARATPQAVDAVHDLGGDLSRHRSRPLSVELIHQADLIFTMSRSHAQAVLTLAPSAADKTTPLDPNKDIEDPIGGDVALYRRLAAELRDLIVSRLGEKLPQELRGAA